MEITFVGILLSLLYWLIFTAVLFFVILFLGHFYKGFKEKLNTKEIYSLFLFSLIVNCIFIIIVYLIPLAFGIKPDLLFDAWYMYLYAYFIIFLKLILYAIVFTIVIQPLILFGLFLYGKFVEKNNDLLSKFYVSIIISFLIILILYIFPWILGGLIALVFF